jgi:hypothetical protein
MSVYTVRPIDDFTIFTTPPSERKGVPFRAHIGDTLGELRYELDAIDASDSVLELAVTPSDIRVDGTLRANARTPAHPGCRLSFRCDAGDLSFTCDTYEGRWQGQMPDWQANLRAIVLTLKALRAVDRYGATKGEQYAGFKALPAGSGATPMGGMTSSEALTILRERSDVPALHNTPDLLREAYRKARARVHPDRQGGDRTMWDQVEQAAKVLGLI